MSPPEAPRPRAKCARSLGELRAESKVALPLRPTSRMFRHEPEKPDPRRRLDPGLARCGVGPSCVGRTQYPTPALTGPRSLRGGDDIRRPVPVVVRQSLLCRHLGRVAERHSPLDRPSRVRRGTGPGRRPHDCGLGGLEKLSVSRAGAAANGAHAGGEDRCPGTGLGRRPVGPHLRWRASPVLEPCPGCDDRFAHDHDA